MFNILKNTNALINLKLANKRNSILIIEPLIFSKQQKIDLHHLQNKGSYYVEIDIKINIF